MDLTIKSTMPAESVVRFTEEVDEYLEADDYQSLNARQDSFARLATQALLEGELGSSVGWAGMFAVCGERIETLFARRDARRAESAVAS